MVGHLVRSVQIASTLAKFFNHEIRGLADRFLMEIEENVNPGTERRQFSKIPFENRKNMQVQIVVCDGRNGNSGYDSTERLCTQYNGF